MNCKLNSVGIISLAEDLHGARSCFLKQKEIKIARKFNSYPW
jgi:hypothetical protein